MKFKNLLYLSLVLLTTSCSGVKTNKDKTAKKEKQPNFLFCVSDDMSWKHTSLMGYSQVKTPGLDRVAKSGITFQNAYANAPSCTASRAAALTGRNGHELEEGGCLWGILPSKFTTYQDILEDNGYFVGFTGKGWGPGDLKDAGRTRNPAGTKYDSIQESFFADMGNDHWQISDNNYAANFIDFLNKRPDGEPFSFWYSSIEPHRDYIKGIGEKSGINLDSIVVPGFMPDTREVRSDIADYLFTGTSAYRCR